MNGVPFSHDYLNVQMSEVRPGTIHTKDTGLYRFYRRYLMQKAISVFDFEIPEEWDRDLMLYVLYEFGFFTIFDTPKFGTIFQPCTLSGRDLYYRPSKVVVTNPLLPDTKTLKIGKDCVLVKLQPDYGGIGDLVGYYADMMALTSETIATNIFNSKLGYVFRVSSKAGAESLKKMFDEIASGQPATFVDKSLMTEDGSPTWDTFSQALDANYIAPKLLDDLRTWEARFLTEVGIPNANTEKKERLIVDEVNSNNYETRSKCELWLESIRNGFDKANDMFGLSLSVDWREDLQTEKEVQTSGNNLDNGPVQAR